MVEEEKKSKKEDNKHKTQVVAQLPTQEVRQGVYEDGVTVNYQTIEEALTEILETVRELKKVL